MPRTENQKATTAYLSLELYDKLEEFKREEALKSDSKAITTILERWFFGEMPIPAIAKTNHLEERLSEVEKTCSMLIDQVAGLIHLSTLSSDDTVPSDVQGIVPDTVISDVPKLVVCKLYKNNAKDSQTWRYWAGAKAGFVEDLSKAKTYTDKGSSRVISQLLEDEIHKPSSREWISCKPMDDIKSLISYRKSLG